MAIRLRPPAHVAAALGLAILSMAAFAPGAGAALPPVYQRARELAAVIEAAAPKLRAPIETVQFIRADLYRVQAGSCTLDVRVIYAPVRVQPGAPAAPGPIQFSAIPQEPTCR